MLKLVEITIVTRSIAIVVKVLIAMTDDDKLLLFFFCLFRVVSVRPCQKCNSNTALQWVRSKAGETHLVSEDPRVDVEPDLLARGLENCHLQLTGTVGGELRLRHQPGQDGSEPHGGLHLLPVQLQPLLQPTLLGRHHQLEVNSREERRGLVQGGDVRGRGLLTLCGVSWAGPC